MKEHPLDIMALDFNVIIKQEDNTVSDGNPLESGISLGAQAYWGKQ